MTDEKKAFFESLPGNIILNSLYIPGVGASHLVTGESNSKLEALQAVHSHLPIFGYKPTKASPDVLPWEDIPLRDKEYWSERNPGMMRGGIGIPLPIRSQRGVEANLPSTKISIYADDYATGKIPWTIRHTYTTNEPEQVENQHRRLKEYFESLGNQKTSKKNNKAFSWKSRYSKNDPWAVEEDDEFKVPKHIEDSDKPVPLKKLPSFEFKSNLRGQAFFDDLTQQVENRRKLNGSPGYERLDIEPFTQATRDFQKQLGLYGDREGNKQSIWWKRTSEQAQEKQKSRMGDLGEFRVIKKDTQKPEEVDELELFLRMKN
jgi:hypothetical protein